MVGSVRTREILLSGDFADWRKQARCLLEEEIAPALVVFRLRSDAQDSLTGLFGGESSVPEAGEGVANLVDEASDAHAAKPGVGARNSQRMASGARSREKGAPRVPASFVAEARIASAHRDEERWALFYRMLWRLTHGEPELLSISIDPDVARFSAMHRSVRRDMHKMTAFVRFREVKTRDEAGQAESWFVAWHEPDHRIVRLTAKFFVERFNGMRFSILTPDECLHWDGVAPVFGPGCTRAEAPRADEAESLWKTYYASIFNPARIKERAMKKEMAVRYWKNLPEAALIPELIRQAPARLQEFYRNNQAPGVDRWLPPPEARTLASLAEAAKSCRACPIGACATQTVFGEGPPGARVVFVGEQPGDQEDREGRPFVGPAGQLLDRALALAGLSRDELYVTNAVKHFKWTPQGKLRLHQRPSSAEIAACKPWLNSELALVSPELLVCLGVSAAQAVLGKAVTLREIRGQWLRSAACERTWVTTHPSAILRVTDPDAQAREFAAFVEDLRAVARAVHETARADGEPRDIDEESARIGIADGESAERGQPD